METAVKPWSDNLPTTAEFTQAEELIANMLDPVVGPFAFAHHLMYVDLNEMIHAEGSAPVTAEYVGYVFSFVDYLSTLAEALTELAAGMAEVLGELNDERV